MLVQVTSVMTRRLGVSSEVYGLIEEAVRLQEVAIAHHREPPQVEVGECSADLGAHALAHGLRIGEQREDLVAVCATFQPESDADAPGYNAETMVRRFPNPIHDRHASEFLGGSDARWAPDLLRASLLDQLEDYRAMLPRRALLRQQRLIGAAAAEPPLDDGEATHDPHVYRTVMWSTLRSVTFHERLLLVVLSVHCLGLAIMAFVTVGFGRAAAQLDVLDASLLTAAGENAAFDALLTASANRSGGFGGGDGYGPSFNMTTASATLLEPQTAVLSLCLLWAVFWPTLSVLVAVVEENEELDFGLAWLVQLAILIADAGARFHKLNDTYRFNEYILCQVRTDRPPWP